jgi:histidine triad (HIT) family protein
MQDSIFTQIIKGQIPCHKIYEDDKTYAFLDIHPIQPGHVLVVPKNQVNEFQNLSITDYTALFNTVKLVANKLKKQYPAKRVGLKIIGLDVAHAHVHVFPFTDINEYNNVPDLSSEPNHAELADIAKQLKITEVN